MDRRDFLQDTSPRESVVVQAVQTEQIQRLYAALHDVQQDLNGKGGLKETLTLLSQHRVSLDAIDHIVNGEKGLRQRQSKTEDRIDAMYCVGKWFVGIFTGMFMTLIGALILWYFSDQWRVREIASRLENASSAKQGVQQGPQIK